MADDFTRFRMAWIDQIWADKELTSTARDIAMRISTRFNRKQYGQSGNFTAWPSYETLASEACVSSKTVQRAVTSLKGRGHITTKGAGGRHCSLTYYAIIKPLVATSDSGNIAEKGGHACPPFTESDAVTGEKVDTSVPKRGHSCPQKVDTSVLQTSLNKHSDEIFDTPASAAARAPIGAVVLALLAAGPGKLPPLPPMLRKNADAFPEMVKDHQAQHGWPDLHDKCLDPSLRTEATARMALEMEPVAIGSDLWRAWKAQYRERGWPMPTALDGHACFPEGGPLKLDRFLDRMRVLMLNGAVDQARNVVRLGAGKVGR